MQSARGLEWKDITGFAVFFGSQKQLHLSMESLNCLELYVLSIFPQKEELQDAYWETHLCFSDPVPSDLLFLTAWKTYLVQGEKELLLNKFSVYCSNCYALSPTALEVPKLIAIQKL